MKAMSDKDLDQLFKQRFDAFETEPAATVWNGIAHQLDGKKAKKKGYPVFWMAAASIVIVISAGLWFYRPVEVIKLQGKADTEMAVNKPEEALLKPRDNVSSAVIEKVNVLLPAKQELAQAKPIEIKKNQAPAHQENADKRDEQLIAKNNAIVSVKQDTKILSQHNVQPALVAKADDSDFRTPDQDTPPKRIRSIGGLLNFVIAQVDKREDKIIEFKDGDEGSEVSGINLGLVQFKSKNK